MWEDDPELAAQKKLLQAGQAAALALAAGLVIWGLMLLFPHPEVAKRPMAVLSAMGWLLVFYGGTVALAILFLRPIAVKINMILIWFVIPACLYYIFVNNWQAEKNIKDPENGKFVQDRGAG